MFLFFSLIFHFVIILFKGDLFYNYEIYSDEIIQKSGAKNFLKIEFVNKFNSFIKQCNDININKLNNYSSFENPKISVIMPIYNGGRYLKNSLVSIEIQNLKEIEIILIDDCSTDNSISIIEDYMKKDLRIRLIKNIKNRKILYSKFFFILNLLEH
jgi:cellulose synthase/poly-beta-1,6-N-acetylglucosamine synthase-like glycosyltransferase